METALVLFFFIRRQRSPEIRKPWSMNRALQGDRQAERDSIRTAFTRCLVGRGAGARTHLSCQPPNARSSIIRLEANNHQEARQGEVITLLLQEMEAEGVRVVGD